jgi:DNA-binding LacI/PurR family transcriptional regulator
VVTIAEVAARAGVGQATVSRVLNNSPRVSDTTRARVLDAIETLDYRPNALAQGLSRGSSRTFAVTVPFLTHPSVVERLRGVVTALNGCPYDLVLFNVESSQRRDEHFARLSGPGRADALLILSMPPPPRAIAKLVRLGTPIVLVGAREPRLASVVTDDVEGGRIATRHLVALGHEHVAFIGDDSGRPLGLSTVADRESGYRQVLRSAGIRARSGFVRYGPADRRAGRRMTEYLLAQRTPPTAIFAASDVQAIGVLEAARAAGLSVPDDLSVVGYDDVEVASYAGLTTVRQPLFDSGHLGARLLLAALASGEPPAPEVHQLSVDLIERSTTAPPHVRRSRGAVARSRSRG